MTTPARTLRALLGAPDRPLVLPGAANALTARVVEDAGFDAVYVTGAGVTNTYLGMPDHGILTLDELCGHVEAICDVVALPVVVDADTGFGNALNVQRAVRRLERAGAAAIQLEDQISPKKCGHFTGKEVVSLGEMVGKVQAAVDARRDDDLLIVARTDARASEGLEAACERAAAYRDAGADVIFVEAPESADEMRYITTQVPGLHIANMVEGGRTPLLPRRTLGELGFAVALYANATMRGAVVGMREVLAHLGKHGDTREAGHLMISWEDRQALVRKPEFDRLEERYAATAERRRVR
ncbi:isocitrate lyase/PEP mutase family protein [Pseudonocardia halophobica]|uniref:isocitrate lyase/PEP mutase family protein n=1 Tax=Pseudonocardia halophobica TaxID=29401 RepID=UPI003D944905